MSNAVQSLNYALELIIESKLESFESAIIDRVIYLERQLENSKSNKHHEILQQKEVFELLGIGRRRLKNWVDRGLPEMRVDNRVYYRYSDLMNFIENK